MPLSQNLVTAECCSEAPCDGRVLFRSEGAAITSDRDRRAAPAGPHRGVGLLVSPRVVPPRPRQRRCASLRDGLRPALTRPGTPALGRRSHRQATRKEEPCSTSTSISAPRTGSPTGPTPTTATTTPVHRLPRYIGRDGAVDLDGRHARDHRVNQWDLDHEHRGEEPAGTPQRPDYPEPIASGGYDRADGQPGQQPGREGEAVRPPGPGVVSAAAAARVGGPARARVSPAWAGPPPRAAVLPACSLDAVGR
jgi:hypothetical protein